MLVSLDDMKIINQDHIPHKKDYDIWISRLSNDEINAIEEKLNEMIEGDEIHTAGWMPGNEWEGTVFMPIYEKACRFNEEMSGMCFGLFVWVVLSRRNECWGFGRYEKDGIKIKSMTYFKIECPEA